MSKRLNPGEEPGARTKRINPMGRIGEMQRTAESRDLPDVGRLRLAQRPSHLHGRRADTWRPAATSTSCAIWTPEQWQAARDAIEEQNKKDRAQRTA